MTETVNGSSAANGSSAKEEKLDSPAYQTNSELQKQFQKEEPTLSSTDVATATDNSAEILRAISASQAMIEFELDGTILTANDNFLNTLGYTLAEVQGKHHSIFLEAGVSAKPAYRQFWEDLRSGKFQAGEFKRIHRNGDEVWIQASYNPVVGADGRVYKVVKNAVDITEKKVEAL
ncbi:MAG: PAS domain-containing protein, partial [Alphaproteobacteria bacterium]|nr:PAS domain-containing protein [Alphaproteobacteria bacterium]